MRLRERADGPRRHTRVRQEREIRSGSTFPSNQPALRPIGADELAAFRNRSRSTHSRNDSAARAPCSTSVFSARGRAWGGVHLELGFDPSGTVVTAGSDGEQQARSRSVSDSNGQLQTTVYRGMPIARFIARQLGNPSGAFGKHLMSRFLNRGNDELVSSALAFLELRSHDRFLDIGFGGGESLYKAGRVITGGHLYGLDRSPDMVALAERRFAEAVHQGQLELTVGDVAALPYPDASVDKLLTANTVYFWPDLAAGLRECIRVLAPGGRIAIAISGARKMQTYGPITSHGFTFFEGPELAERLAKLGLENTRAVALHGRHSYGDLVILGDK